MKDYPFGILGIFEDWSGQASYAMLGMVCLNLALVEIIVFVM